MPHLEPRSKPARWSPKNFPAPQGSLPAVPVVGPEQLKRALPLGVGRLSWLIMVLIDALLVSPLGVEAVAAVGVGTALSLTVLSLGLGALNTVRLAWATAHPTGGALPSATLAEPGRGGSNLWARTALDEPAGPSSHVPRPPLYWAPGPGGCFGRRRCSAGLGRGGGRPGRAGHRLFRPQPGTGDRPDSRARIVARSQEVGWRSHPTRRAHTTTCVWDRFKRRHRSELLCAGARARLGVH